MTENQQLHGHELMIRGIKSSALVSPVAITGSAPTSKWATCPFDVLSSIFRLVCHEESNYPPEYLIAVCKEWKDVGIQDKYLWSKFDIVQEDSLNIDRVLTRTASRLARSGNALLHVKIIFKLTDHYCHGSLCTICSSGKNACDQLLNLLAGEKGCLVDRWKSFIFDDSGLPWTNSANIYPKYAPIIWFASHWRASNLEYMNIRNPERICSRAFASQHPNLRHLVIENCPTAGSVLYPSLTTITIIANDAGFLKSRAVMPKLVILNLYTKRPASSSGYDNGLLRSISGSSFLPQIKSFLLFGNNSPPLKEKAYFLLLLQELANVEVLTICYSLLSMTKKHLQSDTTVLPKLVTLASIGFKDSIPVHHGFPTRTL